MRLFICTGATYARPAVHDLQTCYPSWSRRHLQLVESSLHKRHMSCTRIRRPQVLHSSCYPRRCRYHMCWTSYRRGMQMHRARHYPRTQPPALSTQSSFSSSWRASMFTQTSPVSVFPSLVLTPFPFFPAPNFFHNPDSESGEHCSSKQLSCCWSLAAEEYLCILRSEISAGDDVSLLLTLFYIYTSVSHALISPILPHPVVWVALPPSVPLTHQFHHPSPLLKKVISLEWAHSRLNTFFSANPSHRSLPFRLPDWLHRFPGLFTDTSEHIHFYFLVFLFSTFYLLLPCCISIWLM